MKGEMTGPNKEEIRQISRWQSLPRFDHPPVVETILAVHFKALRQLTTVAVLDFWRGHLAKDFPIAEERPRYEPLIERFDVPGAFPVGQILIGTAPLPSRYWFSSPDRQYLVQVQNDWIAFNWRKQPDVDYDQYERGRDRFRDVWRSFVGFAANLGVKELIPIQCEVTYLNHIQVPAGQPSHDVGTILNVLERSRPTAHLPVPESTALYLQYVIDHNDRPLGRLHVTAEPAFQTNADNTEVVLMNLTARGRPTEASEDGVLSFLNVGHEWVVGGFDELTTDEMHKVWGRREREQ